MSQEHNLKSLGQKINVFTELETFPKPQQVTEVLCICDEVTALCPITGQPDWYKVEVAYRPNRVCVESKTIKLFLQSFRQEGHFCEAFADLIARKFHEVLQPLGIKVTVTQKSRGGVVIKSTAAYDW